MHARSLNRSRLTRTAGGLALFLVGVLLGEQAVRIAGLAPERRPTFSGSVLQECDDPRLAVLNRPGALTVATFRDHRGRVLREVEHRINADGWRGPLAAGDPDPHRLRVACVGDSLMFGLGVAEEQTFPAALERAFARGSPPVEVEALNFGVPGYRAEEKARLIESLLPAHHPQLVLMQVYIQEDARGWSRLARLQARDPLTRWLRPGGAEWVEALRQRSLVVDRVVSALLGRAYHDHWAQANQRATAGSGRAWDELRSGVLHARAAAEAQGAVFALVLFPMLHRHQGEFTSAALGRRLDALAEEQGLLYLDLHAAFEDLPLEPLRVHPEEYHYGPEALELAARATHDLLRARADARLLGTAALRTEH